MIHITVTTAFLLYSVILAAIFLVLYMYTEMGVSRSQRVLARQYLWRCVYCGFTYLDESAEALSECPRCHSLNEEAESRPREVQSKTARERETTPDIEEELRRNPSRRKRPHQKRRGPRRRR